MTVEPKAIADLVEEFVNDEHRDAGKWENRTPLDESGVFSLHRMAADIYAAGFEEGLRTSEARERGTRQREFDADRAAKANEVAS
jgi:hypothetical protein